VINWVHRSTRGWSTGGSVTDPRTGEIIKGVVTLGSLRIRQDYMLAEGILSPYKTGTETPYEAEISRAVERVVIEQLITLAASADMPQVRAVATFKLGKQADLMSGALPGIQDGAEAAHMALLARDIKRYM